MGATRGAVMRIFLMTGAAIGVTGTVAGVVLGVVVCLNVERLREFFSWLSGTTLFNPELYFLSQLPAKMDPGETISVIVMALVLIHCHHFPGLARCQARSGRSIEVRINGG